MSAKHDDIEKKVKTLKIFRPSVKEKNSCGTVNIFMLPEKFISIEGVAGVLMTITQQVVQPK